MLQDPLFLDPWQDSLRRANGLKGGRLRFLVGKIMPPLQHDGPIDYALFTADDRGIRTIIHDHETHVVRVWSWDFATDARPIKDLLLWAELFSGQRFDASGALAPVDAEALSRTWRTLHPR